MTAQAQPATTEVVETDQQAIEPTRRRFTIDEYLQMGEFGILAADERTELIRGEIVEMSPIGIKHASAVNQLNHLLNRRAGDDIIVQVQNPILLPDGSLPQPDLALVRSTYSRASWPTPSDILLVIEIADTSYHYDRQIKMPLYAAAGIPESWIFNVASGRIERHSEPGPDGYQQIALATRGKSLPSTVLPTVTLSIDDVLEPAT